MFDAIPDEVIRRELEPDERLLWAGRPPQGLRLRATDAFFIPFSLLWGGFAVFWEASVISIGAPWFMALWGVPFVLVGLYLIAGRFWVDARQRRRTYYGVTDERVIIISGLFSRTVKSLNLATLSDVSLSERSSGGTITFGQTPPWMFGMPAGTFWPGLPAAMVPTFELATEAREVYDVIRGAQRATRQPA